MTVIDSYLLLFRKWKLQTFKISGEWLHLLLKKRLSHLSFALKKAPHLKASKPNKRRGNLVEEMC